MLFRRGGDRRRSLTAYHQDTGLRGKPARETQAAFSFSRAASDTMISLKF